MSITSGKRVVLGALIVGASALAPAAQAKPVQPALEILSPQRGAVHVAPRADRALTVRVRVAPGVRGLRAVVADRGERVVTRRFTRGADGIWTAQLRPGRELRRGAGAVRVSGKRAGRRVATSAHFWLASRRTELVRVSGLPKRTPARPLDVRLRTGKRVDDVRVRVNGRDVRGLFTRTAGGRWRGSLSASAGLRFGRNRVTVTAYTRNGGFERVSRIVHVRRGRPFAAAGADRLVRQRELVRLDGRATLPRKAEQLRFSWRVVRRPKGSRARLRNPHSVRPRLRPDRPGRYTLRLVVRPRTPRGTASAAAVQGTDTVTVAAQPAVDPKGVPVQTIAVSGQSQPGVQVGGNWYPMAASGAIQVVVLDGSTLELQENITVAGNDNGANYLMDIVEDVSQSSLVILAQPPSRSSYYTQQGVTWLSIAFGTIHFEPDASNARMDFQVPAPGWSFIGSPGSASGRALLSIAQSAGGQQGAMSGRLQNSAADAAGELGTSYVFNWPASFNPFDTQSGGDGSTWNEMTIAGQTYRSDTIAAGSSAFHLVWLDGGTLAKLGEATIAGNNPQQLAQTLNGISESNPAMLFMTTIGHPDVSSSVDGTDNGWAAAASQIGEFGGNVSAFLALDGSANASYSIAGASLSGALAPNAGLDVSRNLKPSAPAPRLVGVLERRPLGAWDVATGGAPSGAADIAALVPDVKRVLAQPDQPFEPFDGPGEAEAEQYIAEKLEISAADPTYGIRANYWNEKLDAQWGNLKDDIGDPNIVPPCPTAPCSQAFAAVQKQLDIEFNAVAEVRTYFGSYSEGTLYQALNQQFVSGQYDFDQVAEYITSKYPPQEPQASGTNPFDVIEGMLDLSAELVPEGGEALGVAGAAVEIAGAFSEGGESSGYLGATVFEAAASQFASTLAQGYTENLSGLNRLADMLVSDAGRLQAAQQGVLNAWAVDSTQLDATLDRSIAAYMWASLLPTAFKAYQCIMPPVYYPPEDFRPAPWYDHDVNTPTGVRYTPFATVTQWPARTPGGWGPNGSPVQQVNDTGFLTVGGEIAGDFTYLDAGVSQDLFGQLDANDVSKLGLSPAYLLAPQPSGGAAGFRLDRGAYDSDDSDENGYVRFLCATNEWREDTNIRGQ